MREEAIFTARKDRDDFDRIEKILQAVGAYRSLSKLKADT